MSLLKSLPFRLAWQKYVAVEYTLPVPAHKLTKVLFRWVILYKTRARGQTKFVLPATGAQTLLKMFGWF
jgi:hypothetical protein